MRDSEESSCVSRRTALLLMACGSAAAAGSGPVTTDAEILTQLDLVAPGMEKVRTAAERGDLSAVQQAYLGYRRTGSTARWHIMPSEMPAIAAAASDPAGEEICRHHIRNYYHFEPTSAEMGADFDWTFNPIPVHDPGFTNEWTWCAISRTEFWKNLVDAYWKTHDEKYAAEWVHELEDFAVKNPMNEAGRGGKVSLWRTLDASERMFNSWPYAYYHSLNSPSFTAHANWTYVRMMRDHAMLLLNGLKDSRRAGNWVASECFGLYTIGTLFPELRGAEAWRRAAIGRIMLELDRTVPPDGFEAELTPNYHMVSVRGFLGPLKLAKLNGAAVPEAIRTKIVAMYRALVMVMDQSGNTVETNDSSPIRADRTAAAGLELGDDPLLEWAASGGRKGTAPPVSTMLPYAGFYAMRGGWNLDDVFLMFRAGPTGIGHEHEDMLQIVLRRWNKTLLLEPGGYAYDHSDWRRFAIGTAAHNTVIVDGKGQHRGPNALPVTGPLANPWVTTPAFDFAAGTYSGGYQESVYAPEKQYQPQTWIGGVDRSVAHTRRVLFLRPDYVLVLDTLDGKGTHTFDAHFHLDSPAARVDPGIQAAFSQNLGPVQLALYPLEREHLAVDIVQGQKDPLLGWAPSAHRPIPTVRFRKQQAAPAIFATILYPYISESPKLRAATLRVGDPGVWSRAISTANEKTEIALALDGTARDFTVQSEWLGSVRVLAAGFVARRNTEGGDGVHGGWGLRSYRDAQLQFTLDMPGTILIRNVDGLPLLFNGGDESITVTFTTPAGIRIVLPPAKWNALR